MKTPRILIADDHQTVRDGLRLRLEHEGWQICGEAADGREAVVRALELRPDIVVLDLHMPHLNGVEATRQIRRALPHTEVLIFSGMEIEQLVHAVFRAGARGYVLKNDMASQIVAAVEALRRHRPFFSPAIAAIVFDSYLKASAPDAAGEAPPRLTAREHEIVQLLAEGKSNKQVAHTLGVSLKTAENHRAAIMRKLRLDSLSALVRYAIRQGIIEA